MTKAQLLERAAAAGVTVPAKATKAQIEAAIAAAGPQPPADLDERWQDAWRVAHRQLLRQRTFETSDLPLLESYIRARARAETTRAMADDEPLVEGSQDQLVANPMFKVSRDAELDAHRYATALILTPEARAKRGIKPDDGKTDGLDDVL